MKKRPSGVQQKMQSGPVPEPARLAFDTVQQQLELFRPQTSTDAITGRPAERPTLKTLARLSFLTLRHIRRSARQSRVMFAKRSHEIMFDDFGGANGFLCNEDPLKRRDKRSIGLRLTAKNPASHRGRRDERFLWADEGFLQIDQI
jgi:hypothetical protein